MPINEDVTAIGRTDGQTLHPHARRRRIKNVIDATTHLYKRSSPSVRAVLFLNDDEGLDNDEI